MLTKCTKCGLSYDVEDSMAGQSVECECGEIFIVEASRAKTGKPEIKKINNSKLENQFKAPWLALVLSIIGMLVFVGGFVILAHARGSLGNLITGFSILASSSVWFALGSIVNYLAEIAYNTRK